jgi:hypothetical protein
VYRKHVIASAQLCRDLLGQLGREITVPVDRGVFSALTD